MAKDMWTITIRLRPGGAGDSIPVLDRKYYSKAQPRYSAEGNSLEFFDEESRQRRVFFGSHFAYELESPEAPFAK